MALLSEISTKFAIYTKQLLLYMRMCYQTNLRYIENDSFCLYIENEKISKIVPKVKCVVNSS